MIDAVGKGGAHPASTNVGSFMTVADVDACGGPI
jgi:hypothetical protein